MTQHIKKSGLDREREKLIILPLHNSTHEYKNMFTFKRSLNVSLLFTELDLYLSREIAALNPAATQAEQESRPEDAERPIILDHFASSGISPRVS